MNKIFSTLLFLFFCTSSASVFAKSKIDIDERVSLLFQECKKDSDLCSFHLFGLRTGYLFGNLKGYSKAGGYILGRYGNEEAYIDGGEHIQKKGEQIIGCYATISMDNIKSAFMQRVRSGGSSLSDYDLLMAQILGELFNDCAYRE